MTDASDIGPTLVAARRALGVSQRELGERVGVKQSQVARWERDAYRGTSLERVEAVAAALGVELGARHGMAAEDASPYGCTVAVTRSDLDAARQEAGRAGLTPEEFVHRALRAALPADETAPWMRYAGMVESGDPYASRTVDEIVYGHED